MAWRQHPAPLPVVRGIEHDNDIATTPRFGKRGAHPWHDFPMGPVRVPKYLLRGSQWFYAYPSGQVHPPGREGVIGTAPDLAAASTVGQGSVLGYGNRAAP